MTAGDVITIVEDNMAKKGCYFDGTDDYILVDAHAVERVAANDTTGTYTAWIYLNEVVTAATTILGAGDNDSTNELLLFQLNSSNQLQIYCKVGGVGQFTVRETSSSIPRRTWTHVAVVQNGVQPALYINGIAVATTNAGITDITAWYDETANIDKFAIGVTESNGAHTNDFQGAIGQVKYWNRALSAAEVLKDYNGEAQTNGDYPDATYLRLNITMNDDGTTDSGAGADNGTLTGHAHYGGLISSHSIALERNCSGHAAEKVTTYPVGPSKLCSVIVRGD